MRNIKIIFILIVIFFSLINNAFALKKFSGLYVFGDYLSFNWPSFLVPLILTGESSYENNASFSQNSEETLNTINEFLNNNPSIDTNAIYTIFTGINDLQSNAQNVALGVSSLYNASVKYILVSNLPDSPSTNHEIIFNFNADLERRIHDTYANVILADTNSLINELSSDPSIYGIDEVFIDVLNFSPKTSEVIGDYFKSLIEAPQIISILPELPKYLLLYHNNLISMYGMMSGTANGENIFSIFSNLSNSKTDIDLSENSVALDNKNMSATFGFDYKLTENFLTGFGFSYGINNGSFGSSHGDLKLNSMIFSGFAAYRQDRINLNLIFSKGLFQFDSIKRNVVLGDLIRKCIGDTTGGSEGIQTKVNIAIYKNNQFEIGPELGVDYESITITSYAEKNMDSTSMNFADQNVHTIMVNAGLFTNYRLDYSLGKLMFFSKVIYQHDYNTEINYLRAGLNNFSNITYEMPGYNPKSEATQVTLGLNFDISDRFQGVFSYSYKFGTKASENCINLGLKY